MGDLANGLGNLASRVSTLLAKNDLSVSLDGEFDKTMAEEFKVKMNKFLFNEALNVIWEALRAADAKLSHDEPWKMTDTAEVAKVLSPIVHTLRQAGQLLASLLPETAEKLQTQFNQEQISKGEALFPRLD